MSYGSQAETSTVLTSSGQFCAVVLHLVLECCFKVWFCVPPSNGCYLIYIQCCLINIESQLPLLATKNSVKHYQMQPSLRESPLATCILRDIVLFPSWNLIHNYFVFFDLCFMYLQMDCKLLEGVKSVFLSTTASPAPSIFLNI